MAIKSIDFRPSNGQNAFRANSGNGVPKECHCRQTVLANPTPCIIGNTHLPAMVGEDSARLNSKEKGDSDGKIPWSRDHFSTDIGMVLQPVLKRTE